MHCLPVWELSSACRAYATVPFRHCCYSGVVDRLEAWNFVKILTKTWKEVVHLWLSNWEEPFVDTTIGLPKSQPTQRMKISLFLLHEVSSFLLYCPPFSYTYGYNLGGYFLLAIRLELFGADGDDRKNLWWRWQNPFSLRIWDWCLSPVYGKDTSNGWRKLVCS